MYNTVKQKISKYDNIVTIKLTIKENNSIIFC